MIPDIDDFYSISNPDDLRGAPPNYKKLFLMYFVPLILVPMLLTRITYMLNPPFIENYMKDNELDSVNQALYLMMGQSIVMWSLFLLVLALLIFLALFLIHKRDKKRVTGRLDVPAHQGNSQWIRVKESTEAEYLKGMSWADRNPSLAYFVMMVGVAIAGLVVGSLLMLVALFLLP